MSKHTVRAPRTSKKFTSRIPGKQWNEYAGLDALPVGGRIGPWSERVVAVHRTMEALLWALDGIETVPTELIPNLDIQHAKKQAHEAGRTLALIMARVIASESPVR